MKYWLLSLTLFGTLAVSAQSPKDIYRIIDSISQERIAHDVAKLAGFGTRHTLSDTLSSKRGIGAARRWIKAEFKKISTDCSNCLEVKEQHNLVSKGSGDRIVKDVNIVNILAIQHSKKNPKRFVMMSGDIDSRISDPNDYTNDSPGANDNASGMAGTIEAARVLSQYDFDYGIIYAGLSGEEQGLFGGAGLAEWIKEQGWELIGVINNDMIGNIKGVDGVVSNRDFRIFSEPTPVTETEAARKARRFYGGEVDGVSRQLARYVHKTVRTYMPEMNPMMVYRLDRFGRGGHHRPFNDAGFAGIRIMEAHEDYTKQHQDLRRENGIDYGDVLSGVDFAYNAKLTAVNAISLASLAWAPAAPEQVSIGGIVEADTRLQWTPVADAAYYKVYWRDTTSPTWDHHRVIYGATQATLQGIVIDNYFFGVAAVDADGFESMVVFPNKIMR
jgi:Zn-dependent M28 family amino/carboxypeptidase